MPPTSEDERWIARCLELAREAEAAGEVPVGALVVVDGAVDEDVTLLGDPARIRHIFLGGSEINLPPPEPRRDPPGWRVSHYGDAILTQQVARRGRDGDD